ncbi:MAG TPA: hypothetical protein VF221_03235 [Chloroflexota bacterium]
MRVSSATLLALGFLLALFGSARGGTRTPADRPPRVVAASLGTACAHPPAGSPTPARFPRHLHLGRSIEDIAASQLTQRIFVLSQPSTTAELAAHCPQSIFVLDGTSGAVMKTITVPTEHLEHPVVDETDQRLFVASFADGTGDGQIMAVDTRSGRLVSITKVGGFPGPLVLVPSTGRLFVWSYFPPPGKSCPCPSTLSVLDPKTGKVVAHGPDSTGPTFAVDDVHRRIYNLNGSRLLALDGRTGTLLWTMQVPPCGDAAAVFIPWTGRLFTTVGGSIQIEVGGEPVETDGHLCVIDPATRRVIRDDNLGGGGADIPAGVDQRERVVLTIEAPTVYVGGISPGGGPGPVNVRNGGDDQVRYITLRVANSAAINSITGKAYLLNSGVPGANQPATVWELDPATHHTRTVAHGQRGTRMALVDSARRVFLGDTYSDTVTVFCMDAKC